MEDQFLLKGNKTCACEICDTLAARRWNYHSILTLWDKINTAQKKGAASMKLGRLELFCF